MCNRYAADIRKANLEGEYWGFEEWSETGQNIVLEVFPDRVGPVIRKRMDGTLEWAAMRWGLPGPPQFGALPVTNLRNVASAHWRPLLGVEHRCLVPFTAFSEYDDSSPKGAKLLRWFARPDRGMAMFAGIWRQWEGVRGTKKEPIEGKHLLFSFLTTEANDLVRPIHAKAMPLVLTDREQQEEWLNAPAADIAKIQARKLPAEALQLMRDDETEMFAPPRKKAVK
ncbi:SOS response-associated peptidase family protein [Vitreimonas flagellata]|uniref:SOS response-associated peptidase family protein n=1 Tax=Vitreimonas flagellata TaxID=2560861 RepID=UPI00107551BC|nr:SOS response-associated peptidase family protein [Vitreimonas flagellata]